MTANHTDDNPLDGADDLPPIPEPVLSTDEFEDLAIDYRDALLKDLGVVGIEHSTERRSFDTPLRSHWPVEKAASMNRSFNATNHSRSLYDISDHESEADNGESVSAHERSKFATVRHTTGYAAINSSATLTLCWEQLPTPREVLVAEYLDSQTGRTPNDLRPENPVYEGENVAERLIEAIFGQSLSVNHELRLPWVDVSETSIGNVEAIESHVSGCIAKLNGREMLINPVRTGSDRSRTDDYPFSRWETELGRVTLAVESYDTGLNYPYQDRTFGRGFGRPVAEGWHELDLSVDGLGYASGTIHYDQLENDPDPDDELLFGEDQEDDETLDIETRVVCVPECQHPSIVLDENEYNVSLEHADPDTPIAGPRTDNSNN